MDSTWTIFLEPRAFPLCVMRIDTCQREKMNISHPSRFVSAQCPGHKHDIAGKNDEERGGIRGPPSQSEVLKLIEKSSFSTFVQDVQSKMKQNAGTGSYNSFGVGTYIPSWIPVVPLKAVAKVSKIGRYRRGELLWCMDGRANPLMDRKVVGVELCFLVTSPTTAGCSVV